MDDTDVGFLGFLLGLGFGLLCSSFSGLGSFYSRVG